MPSFLEPNYKTCGPEGVCLFGALDPPAGGFGHLLFCSSQPAGS